MIVVQHLWSHWTKASRPAAAQRPRLPDAASLAAPVGEAPGKTWLHDIRRLEREGFERREGSGWTTSADWGSREPLSPANVSWRPRAGGGVEVSVHRPWPLMLRTAWPEALPTPLLALPPEAVGKIVWNGRFFASAGGSDRSYFYAEHVVLIVETERPEPDLFTATPPARTVDLRTRIY